MYVTGEVLVGSSSLHHSRPLDQKISQTVGDSETAQSLSEITIPASDQALKLGPMPDTTIGDAFEGVKALLFVFAGIFHRRLPKCGPRFRVSLTGTPTLRPTPSRNLRQNIDKVFKGAKLDVELRRLRATDSCRSDERDLWVPDTKDESFLKGSSHRGAASSTSRRRAFDPNNVEHLLEDLPEFARAPAMQCGSRSTTCRSICPSFEQ